MPLLPLHQHFLQTCIEPGICSSFGVYLSPLIEYREPSYTNNASRGYEVNMFVFNELRRYCLHQRSFAINVWRATKSLGNCMGCLQLPIGPLWPKIHLDVTNPWYFPSWLELSRWSYVFPIIQQFHLSHLLIFACIRTLLLHQVSILFLKGLLILVELFCIFSFIHLFFLTTQMMLYFKSTCPIHPLISNLFPLTRDIYFP